MSVTLLLLVASLAAAAEAPRFGAMTEEQLSRELAAVHASAADLPARLFAVSERFLGTPYKLGPLGEGPDGEFDRDPLISFQQADCTTFVEEAMALALAPDLGSAGDVLRRIRYKDGVVGYEARNHFPETDWLPNNMKAGFLEDATLRVAGRRAAWVFKTISKRDWYAAKSTSDLEGFGGEPPDERERRVERWRALGARARDENARLPYVPLELLPELLPQVPSGAVASVVREALPDKPVVVTHQLFILQTARGPIVRHAAFGKQVQDEPAAAYFARLSGAKWRVLGVNLARVLAGSRQQGPLVPAGDRP